MNIPVKTLLGWMVAAALLLPSAVYGQPAPAGTPWEVFLQRSATGDKLTFINILTGDTKTVQVEGERYTPFNGQVMYFDTATSRVMLAAPDGTTQEHPFIQPGADTQRVDWLPSPDGKRIAWTLTNGTSDRLTTITTVADANGPDSRQVLTDGPRQSIHAMPVAFSQDGNTLYMDFQPAGIGDFTPYRQYAGLFGVDLSSGKWAYLKGEPGCFCGAGFGDGLLLRLNVTKDLSGFDLRVVNLAGAVEQTIPALKLRNYTQAGDIVLSPDGSKAVYALAQVRNFGTPNQLVRTVFVLVDLQTMTQTGLTDPITTFVQPIAWTEDDTAVIFTSRQREGTWKISLSDGKLTKVSDATYLGIIQ
jgi:hypothetical protein